MTIDIKNLTLAQIDNHIRSLEEKIASLETQVHDCRSIITASNKTWKDMLRTELIRMLVDKDEAIKNIGADAEHVLIKTALEFNCNRRQETATILGYGRNTITKKVTELNIDI